MLLSSKQNISRFIVSILVATFLTGNIYAGGLEMKAEAAGNEFHLGAPIPIKLTFINKAEEQKKFALILVSNHSARSLVFSTPEGWTQRFGENYTDWNRTIDGIIDYIVRKGESYEVTVYLQDYMKLMTPGKHTLTVTHRVLKIHSTFEIEIKSFNKSKLLNFIDGKVREIKTGKIDVFEIIQECKYIARPELYEVYFSILNNNDLSRDWDFAYFDLANLVIINKDLFEKVADKISKLDNPKGLNQFFLGLKSRDHVLTVDQIKRLLKTENPEVSKMVTSYAHEMGVELPNQETINKNEKGNELSKDELSQREKKAKDSTGKLWILAIIVPVALLSIVFIFRRLKRLKA